MEEPCAAALGAGWGGDGVGAEGCYDLDECELDSHTCATSCVNTEGGYDCTPCPEGTRGDPKVSCVTVTSCEENNGGCSMDPLVDCIQPSPEEDPTCGPCPEGYSGSGDTACVDIDACSPDYPPNGGAAPCFPGVVCTDAPPPSLEHSCGACPVGYSGDGAACSLCDTSVQIVSSNINDGGSARRSQPITIDGHLYGMEAGCNGEGGHKFQWTVVSSDNTVKYDTSAALLPKLTIPKKSLPVLPKGRSYTATLQACLSGNFKVTARLHDCADARPHDGTDARPHDCTDARPHDCTAA